MRDGMTAYQARSHLPAQAQKPSFRLYTLGSLGLSKVRYELMAWKCLGPSSNKG